MNETNRQYHLCISPGDVGSYCILPGDPGRCEQIAKRLASPRLVSRNREYEIWNGELCGVTVTVCSTGIGGPSAAIAVEELANCGAHTMIRVGTCGGISLDVRSGDAVIATGAVRQEGTTAEYAPLAYPAVASHEVLFALCREARERGIPHHVGVVQSKDSFYGQHSPDRMPVEARLKELWEAWRRLGVLASEMEASTLFTVGAYRRLRCGAVFLSVWNQERASAGLDTDADETHDTSLAIDLAIGALRRLIEEDREKSNKIV